MSAPAIRLLDQSRNTPESVPPIPAREPVPAHHIEAYWDDVQERVLFLMQLMEAGRHREALTLCATYLEAVAHALVSVRRTGDDDFEDEIEERSSDPYLVLVHPLQLVRVAASIEALAPESVHLLSDILSGPELTLLHREEAITVIRASLEPDQAALVERVLWKCTIAYVLYDFLRSQSFRRREGARTVGLGATPHEGPPVQGLSVPELVGLLQGMVAEARARSHATGMLPDWD